MRGPILPQHLKNLYVFLRTRKWRDNVEIIYQMISWFPHFHVPITRIKAFESTHSSTRFLQTVCNRDIWRFSTFPRMFLKPGLIPRAFLLPDKYEILNGGSYKAPKIHKILVLKIRWIEIEVRRDLLKNKLSKSCPKLISETFVKIGSYCDGWQTSLQALKTFIFCFLTY